MGSACLLLRLGAVDAEAYPEAARNVLQILWDVGTSRHSGHGSVWAKARVSAYDALTHYEVVHIQKSIPDFKKRNMNCLLLRLILKYYGPWNTQRRFVKEKRVAVNKIEKFLDVFPQVIFASGNTTGASQLPGAALFCLSLTPKDMTTGQQKVQGLQDVHAKYENALVEIVASLQLSRNILIALLSLQSWKPFMQRWLRACVTFLDAKAPSTVLDKTSKAANGILKSLEKLVISRSCLHLPMLLNQLLSKFLLDWLFQYEHEHRQWSAAISLGLISSCLHVTDHKQKFQNIEALIQVSSCSRSTLVKGACGVGLRFSCQDLLTWVEASDESDLEKETCKMLEVDLLGKIIRALSQMISQFTPSSSDLLESLSVVQMILIHISGAHDVVQKIKAFILSWIPHLNHSVQNSFSSEGLDIVLFVGSCLALPSMVAFCPRVELMYDNKLDQLVSGFRELISELVSVRKSGIFHQSLLMASCIGAGSLLACILNEGVHSLKVEVVKDLLALFRKSYSNPHPPLTHFGGMLGVVNALGEGHVLESQLTSLVQEMFLVTQNSDDDQLQQYAAWVVSFLRHCLWFRELQNTDSSFPSNTAGQKSVLKKFPDDNVVMELSLWLMHLNYPGVGLLLDCEEMLSEALYCS
ncbi:hypothetical protein ACSBR2_012848 [Camellia fascicularis]